MPTQIFNFDTNFILQYLFYLSEIISINKSELHLNIKLELWLTWLLAKSKINSVLRDDQTYMLPGIKCDRNAKLVAQ